MPPQERTTKGRRAGRLTEVEVPASMADYLAGARTSYETASGCSVILGREPAKKAPAGIWIPEGASMLWHLSISHRHRYPEWDEIADVRYALVPKEITMALLLPPPEDYVNVDERCFHLWQVDDRRIDGA